MKNKIILILCFICVFWAGYFCRMYTVNNIIPPNPQIIIKDSIIRDSIYIINDSIKLEIKYIEKEHNEEVSNIISNTDSSNLVFFTRFLENFEQTTKVS